MNKSFTINSDDVYMKSSQDRPPYFREDVALAILLTDEVLFTNTSGGDDPTVCCYVNCNDIFAPAADAESVEECELETLWKCYEEDPFWGPTLWVLLRRQMMPWNRVLEKLKTPGMHPELSQWEKWNIDDVIQTSDWMAAYVKKKGWNLSDGQLTYPYSRTQIELKHGPTLEQEKVEI